MVIEPKANAKSFPRDLAVAVKGMYRILDLVNESGSNGYGKASSWQACDQLPKGEVPSSLLYYLRVRCSWLILGHS